jgi:acyl dehydratase
MSGRKLYLEDLAVGDEFRSGEHTLDAEQIIAFAKQFDPQPFHIDEAAAKESYFQGLAASGWHTMAISMKLIVAAIPLAEGIIGAGGEISWPRPTRPGDVLHVESRVMEIKPSRSKPDRGRVTIRTQTYNQKGEVLQDFTASVLVFARGASVP